MTTYDLTARRRYSREEKAAIVAESVREGAVSAVARRHRVAPAQLFRWKKEFAPVAETVDPVSPPTAPAAASKFVPVAIAPAASRARQTRQPKPIPMADGAAGAVEIAFPNGCVLTAPADIGEAALSCLVRALTA